MSEKEYQNCLIDCVVLKGTICINGMLDHVSEFNGDPKKILKKFVEYNLYFFAHNWSEYD